MTRILVVDDEPLLRRTLALNLTARGYDVTTAATATAALHDITMAAPDLLILDLGLPDLDGLNVIRRLRRSAPDLPVVVLSARAASQDIVTALDLGAVDYVVKPFDMNELIARLRAATRRGASPTHPVVVGTIEVDFEALTATSTAGASIHLTPTEWRILEVLLHNPGRLVPSRDLLTAARGDPAHTANGYLRMYIAQLRRKLEPDPQRPQHLLTELGMGYRFRP